MGGIKSYIHGQSGYPLHIGQDGEIHVTIHPHPPVTNETIMTLPFRSYFLNSGGSNSMRINGSVTNQDFYIEAAGDYDIYITTISVVIGDGGSPNLNDFGALGGALSNGISWIWFTQEEDEYTLHDGIKTNLEFIRLGNKSYTFGDGVNAFLADVSGGATEKSYLPVIDIPTLFGIPYGIRLRKGTTDKLIFRVRDNLAGLSTMNIIGYGLRI